MLKAHKYTRKKNNQNNNKTLKHRTNVVVTAMPSDRERDKKEKTLKYTIIQTNL